jgi:LysR family glycine cleavage system transcriptional activator
MAARWLVPRLPRFKARFPRINLHVKTSQSLANFKSDGVDIAIRFGAGDWKGLRATKLLHEEFFPLCSPSFNGGRLPKDALAMLAEPLLIDRNLSWHAWFKSAGLKLDREIAGTSFTDTNALMEAAVTGQALRSGAVRSPDWIFWRASWCACPNTACALPTAITRFIRSLRSPTRRLWPSGTG